MAEVIRQFETGANRDLEGEKLDYEAFFSTRVLSRYAKYMHEHRKIADGTLRDGDNWQKGIPIEVYQKSLVRHLFQAWGAWRGDNAVDDRGKTIAVETALCSIVFNAMGYLHELTRQQNPRVLGGGVAK